MIEETNQTSTERSPSSSGKFRPFRPSPVVVGLAYLAAIWERLWPLLVPGFLIICLYASVSWFGLWQVLSDVYRYAGLALFAVSLLASLYPLRYFLIPDRTEILRRIERASDFKHRPVTAQSDVAANASQDDFSRVLWLEHKRRMADKLSDMASGVAKPDANRFDKYALRAIVPLLVFIAWGYSFGASGGRLGDAINPRVDADLVLSRLDVWINPPAYTAKPPIYLTNKVGANAQLTSKAGAAADNDGLNNVAKLATVSGSELKLRYVGEEEIRARLVKTVSAENSANLDDKSKAPEIIKIFEPESVIGAETVQAPVKAPVAETALASKLEQSGTIEVLVRDTIVASWPVEIFKDQKPKIAFEAPPSTALTGALELNYSVEDDFGVISAKGIIKSLEAENPNARPLVAAPELELSLPRARAKSGSVKLNRDFSDHPWAGGEVELTLEAEDDPGQIGRSQPFKIKLPGRLFTDPMAKAIVEQRRILAKDANQAVYVVSLLDAITTRPDDFKIDPKTYLALSVARGMILPSTSDDKKREGLDVLWETALALELGDLSEVERRLREAQEKLSKALEQGASEEEISKLMEELRQAMNDFLEQMQKEMAKNPIQNNPLNNQNNTQSLTQKDLEKMMDRIEDLAKSGSKDAARELLAEMQRMMDNLRAGQHQQQQQQEGNQLNQALDKLSELMQRQQELMDETFSMERKQQDMRQRQQEQNQRQNGQQQGQQQPGEKGQKGENQTGEKGAEQGENGDTPMSPQELADALKQLQEQQKALQEQLSELGEKLEEQGLDPSKEFGEAGDEMAEAGKNLGKGKSGDAAGDQGRALDALRRGAQSMMQQMAGDRNQGGQQPGQQGRSGRDQARQDPLGRNSGPRGQINDENTKIPGEIDAQRAREIMDAIRKRLSDPTRPLIERNYLERLLEGR